jgi:hypothetical protein
MTTQVLAKLRNHVERIARGEHEQIGPGVPARLSEALEPGEGGAQGDVYIVVGSGVPKDYVLVQHPTEKDRHVAWDSGTVGSNHRLDSLEGVVMYRPANWGPESLDGPYLICEQERVIEHPTHGHVIIPAGMEVQISYPQDYDEMQKRARRSAD